MINASKMLSAIQNGLVQEFKYAQDTEIHVSRFIDCARKGYLSMQSMNSGDVDIKSTVYFTKGTATEIWFVGLLKRLEARGLLDLQWPRIQNGGLVQYLIEIPGKYFKATGSVDAVIIPRSDLIADSQTPHLLEIKSIGGRSFKGLDRYGPQKSHVRQLQAYLHWSKVKHGAIIYIDRDNYVELDDGLELLRIRVFPIAYDPVIAKEIAHRLTRVEKGLKFNKLPPRDGTGPTDDICKFCKFREFCWGVRPISLAVKRNG